MICYNKNMNIKIIDKKITESELREIEVQNVSVRDKMKTIILKYLS